MGLDGNRLNLTWWYLTMHRVPLMSGTYYYLNTCNNNIVYRYTGVHKSINLHVQAVQNSRHSVH